MAKKNSPAEQATPAERTDPIDITPQNGYSLSLAACYRGLFHLFGVRVSNWNVTEDGIFAEGVTAFAGTDIFRVLHDVSRNVKRPQLWPTLKYIMGVSEPEPFEDSAAITVFMTQNFKGAEDENSSRTPAYVLAAAKDLKVRTGTVKARGPKPRTIDLKNLAEFNPAALEAAGIPADQIQAFIDKLSGYVASQPSTPVEATA